VFHGVSAESANGDISSLMRSAFARGIAEPYGISWELHTLKRPCRCVVAVSCSGHCLNSLLHRSTTGTLPIDVVAVVSNDDALRGLADWQGGRSVASLIGGETGA